MKHQVKHKVVPAAETLVAESRLYVFFSTRSTKHQTLISEHVSRRSLSRATRTPRKTPPHHPVGRSTNTSSTQQQPPQRHQADQSRHADFPTPRQTDPCPEYHTASTASPGDQTSENGVANGYPVQLLPSSGSGSGSGSASVSVPGQGQVPFHYRKLEPNPIK
ncbi:unnamed protein product [[Candida] boidinii]|nr:unnamed protein product [[Candida] boidinii]